MRLNEIRTKFKHDILALAEKHQAESVRLFGSVARGEDDTNDVDFLVHFRQFTAWAGNYTGLRDDLQHLLGTDVGVVDDTAIGPYHKARILDEAVPLDSTRVAVTQPPMTEERDKTYLLYIQRACETIIDYTSRGSREQMVQDAVMMQELVIGENANHISTQLKDAYPEVDWKKAIGMRNVIAHDYEGANPEIVWNTATKDIPVLKSHIDRIIATMEQDERLSAASPTDRKPGE